MLGFVSQAEKWLSGNNNAPLFLSLPLNNPEVVCAKILYEFYTNFFLKLYIFRYFDSSIFEIDTC